ncbi:Enzymatic polyprotein [Eumeta japonica]|uniref:Enzymatic polyprotein n=1 Tax=Eumeta variegata TaxID=151549 RepID=A0A4C1SWX2_EUMVA|nr:Enzymatic polyprotein [Eumeta japonica]
MLLLIGRDLISQGLSVEISCDSLAIKRVKIVNACDVGKWVKNLHLIETDVSGEERFQLLSIFGHYASSFEVEGTPTGRVTSGELEIRLSDSNRTVQRRPCRLSADERQLVREKLTELLDAGVIRPNCSPFSNAILLVKNKDGTDRMRVDYIELNSNTVLDKYPYRPLAHRRSDSAFKWSKVFYMSGYD